MGTTYGWGKLARDTALAVGLGTALAACDDSSNRIVAKPSSTIVVGRTYYGPRNYADLWEDAETGCQYLGYGASLGLTPRLGADGKPICRGVPSPTINGATDGRR